MGSCAPCPVLGADGVGKRSLTMMIAVLAALLLTAVSFAFFGVYGIPVLVLSLLGFAVYLATAKKENAALGTIEKNRGPEPTGRPRMATGSAETANERQGQV